MVVISPRTIPFLCGLVMSINFLFFWAVPIAGMGQLWKIGLKSLLSPLYEWLDCSSYVRRFAREYVYTKTEHSDFLAMSILLVVNASISFGVILRQQLVCGHLPWWMIFAYYCSWVGLGGRIMGAAYALAHKEVCFFSPS